MTAPALPIAADYFFAEQPLIERVKELAPELQFVFGFAENEDAEKCDRLPFGAVIYLGAEKASGVSNGAANWRQLYSVSVVVGIGEGETSRARARSLAGPILSKLMLGLSGWKLPAMAGVRALEIVDGPEPLYVRGRAVFTLTIAVPALMPGVQ